MNLSDINENALYLEKEMLKLEKTINELQEIVNKTYNFNYNFINTIVNKEIVGGNDACIINARGLKNLGVSFNSSFLQNLRAINFNETIFILANLKNKYEYFNLDAFIDNFLNNANIIHSFNMSKNDEESTSKFLDAYNAIQSIIYSYKLILAKIEEVHNINSKLCNIENGNYFKIRLLNENNKISNLIENITIIKSIYDNINTLIGDESIELEYKRVESGTIEITLAGCAASFGAFVAFLTFTYNFYAQNFSWKTKQEKIAGEIKIRGDIVKLIKEYGELNPEDQERVQQCFAELESNGKKLFINNPLIKLNNEEIGLKESKEQNISKELIEFEMKKIEEKQVDLEYKEEIKLIN